ncbi:MAG: universal stress protein [Bacteroidia bacterium]|nr:universal stress protein [Bacteroidia bacterium]
MGKLLAGIDYSAASVRALEALFPLRQAIRSPIVLYHAYQLPKGFPFLSAHVIEGMEAEAERSAQQQMRRFLEESIPRAEARRIRIVTQRDFLTEGLSRHLQTRQFSLLALGARGDAEPEEEPIGFHARHFILQSPIPVLITFPKTTVRWKRLLLAYEPSFRSPVGQRFLRQVVQRLSLPVAGLPLIRPDLRIERIHNRIKKMLRPETYHEVRWEGAYLVRLLLQAAKFQNADVIAYFADPQIILQGMRAMSEQELDAQAAWLFFPRMPKEEVEPQPYS